MAPDSVLRCRCINAVYLNNAAVTFLVHGKHHRASQACKGALRLIKSLVTMTTPPIHVDAVSGTVTSVASLHWFEQIAMSTTARCLAGLSTTQDSKTQLQVVTFDESLTSSFVQMECSSETLLAIRIDDVSLSSCCEDQATLLAIVLSNFALARWFLTLHSTVDLLNYNSWHLLDNGLSIMGVLDRTMDVSEGNMFIAVALSRNLSGILAMVRDTVDHDDSFMAIACSARQELAMLVELALSLTDVTSMFVPSAGMA
jgi:hypothetical protein